MELKTRFYHLNLCQCKSKSNLKTVSVNHVLLGFFIYVSQLHSIAHTIKSIKHFQNMVLLNIHQIHHQIHLILSLH